MEKLGITDSEIEALRAIRKSETIEALAREIGASWHSVYSWIKGTKRPGPMATRAIRDFLRRYKASAGA